MEQFLTQGYAAGPGALPGPEALAGQCTWWKALHERFFSAFPQTPASSFLQLRRRSLSSLLQGTPQGERLVLLQWIAAHDAGVRYLLGRYEQGVRDEIRTLFSAQEAARAYAAHSWR